MKAWSKQFAGVFLIGFLAFVIALGYGQLSGSMLDGNPFLVALRYFGLTAMAAGLALWIVRRRDEAGQPGLNPLLGLLVGVGLVLALIGLLAPFSAVSPLLGIGGLALAALALLIGFVVMLFAPAYPAPLTKHWEEPGEAAPAASSHHVVEAHSSGEAAPESAEPDDLTRIEGIGPKLQSVLYEAGIKTYVNLAAQAPDDIETVVKAADFKAPFNPATWPSQAELAAAGDWQALEALQSELNAGRRAG